MTTPARLLTAYRRTVYRVGDDTVRIGRRTPLLGTLLTAWNPMSRRMPLGWNHRMQSRLRAHARRWPVTDAAGGLGTWHEDHLLVMADPRPSRVLARRFRQRAIVILLPGRPARLCILR